MRVAAIQHDIVWEDPEATCAMLAPRVGQAAAAGADLVVLAEMFATGFSMEPDRTGQDEDGSIVTWMHEQAATHGVRLTGSVAITGDGDHLPTNRMFVVGPSGIEARYDKIHPFSYSGEHERFAAGTKTTIVEIAGVRCALTVCFDLRFANLYWGLADQVDAYLVVANWPASRRVHWTSLLRARAIENQAWVIGVNRVGDGNGLAYAGDTQVIDPLGEIAAAAAGGEALLVTDVERAQVAAARERFPFLADRKAL